MNARAVDSSPVARRIDNRLVTAGDRLARSRLTQDRLDVLCEALLVERHGGAGMQGVITGRHALRHPVLVIRGFGWRVFARCIRSTLLLSRETFLSILASGR